MELFDSNETPPKQQPLNLMLKSKFYKTPPKHNLFSPKPKPVPVEILKQSAAQAMDSDTDESMTDQENKPPPIFQPQAFQNFQKSCAVSAPQRVPVTSISKQSSPVSPNRPPALPKYSPPVPQIQPSRGNVISAPQFSRVKTPSGGSESGGEPVPDVMSQSTNTAVHPFFRKKMFRPPPIHAKQGTAKISEGNKDGAPVERVRKFSGLKQDPASLTKHVTVFDVGQKEFGAKSCKQCGMCFNRSIVSDRDAHRIYHARATLVTKFPKTIPFGTNSAIEHLDDYSSVTASMIQVKSSLEPKGDFYNKFVKLRKFIDEELGSNVQTDTMNSGQRAYIYLNQDRIACGFLLAGLVMNNEESNVRRLRSGTSSRHHQWFLGVQVVWVHKPFRRNGIARELLDATRATFFQEHISIDQVAFSDTTSDGNQFAVAYCGTEDYNVYRFRST